MHGGDSDSFGSFHIFGTFIVIFFFLAPVTVASTTTGHSWSYNEGNGDGPSNWNLADANCGKNRQSPIDIQLNKSTYDPALKPFYFTDTYYIVESDDNHTIINNGHTIQVTLSSISKTMSSGGLPSSYKLLQLHMHWGSDDKKGSEHTFDSKTFPLEIHLVHKNVDAAAEVGVSLAVLGVFAEIGTRKNPAMQTIIDSLSHVKYAGTNSSQVSVLNVIDLLPYNHDNFFRYLGSLTTPPCSEYVVWTVFQKPIVVTQQQVAALRQVFSSKHGEMEHALVNNYRPVQKLNGRVVKRSFLINEDKKAAGLELKSTIVLPMLALLAGFGLAHLNL